VGIGSLWKMYKRDIHFFSNTNSSDISCLWDEMMFLNVCSTSVSHFLPLSLFPPYFSSDNMVFARHLFPGFWKKHVCLLSPWYIYHIIYRISTVHFRFNGDGEQASTRHFYNSHVVLITLNRMLLLLCCPFQTQARLSTEWERVSPQKEKET